jgi:hypothetical protein
MEKEEIDTEVFVRFCTPINAVPGDPAKPSARISKLIVVVFVESATDVLPFVFPVVSINTRLPFGVVAVTVADILTL